MYSAESQQASFNQFESADDKVAFDCHLKVHCFKHIFDKPGSASASFRIGKPAGKTKINIIALFITSQVGINDTEMIAKTQTEVHIIAADNSQIFPEIFGWGCQKVHTARHTRNDIP